MNDYWNEIFNKSNLPKVNQCKKQQAIEQLKVEIANTEIIVKENYFQKLKSYIPFISKTNLLIQVTLMLIGMFVITSMTFERTRLLLSLVMPILACLQRIELEKSFKYNMYQIEMSCKTNLKELISIKLIINIAINLSIITIFAFMTGIQFQYASYSLIIYFLVPFMLTNVINLQLAKRLKNKSNEITNIVVMLLVNIVVFILNIKFPYVYEASSIFVWMMVFILTMVYSIKLIYQFYEKEEDYIWNLQ